jgi:hypothetical protein
MPRTKGSFQKALVPQHVIDEARKLRAADPERWNWNAIGRRFGFHSETIRRRVDPIFETHMQDRGRERAARKRRRVCFYLEERPIPDEELQKRRQLIPQDTRDFTARLCGDPIPNDPRRATA